MENLQELIWSIGKRPSQTRLHQLLEDVDKDKSGTIEWEEFLVGYDKLVEAENEDKKEMDIGKLIKLFQRLDKDGSGAVTVDELEGLLVASDQNDSSKSLSREDAYEILKLADKDGDGTIELSEFIDFVSNSDDIDDWRLTNGFRVIMIFGGPKSGKEDLCENLLSLGKIQHFRADVAAREEIIAQTPLGKKIEFSIAQGGLVLSTTIIALLKKQLAYSPGSIFVLDGYPRTVDSFREVQEICGPPEMAIYLDVPDEVMLERMLQTSSCSDNDAQWEIKSFREACTPTLEALRESNVCVQTLDAIKEPEEVWSERLLKSPIIRGQIERGSE